MEIAQLDNTVLQTCWNYSGHRMASATTEGNIQVWNTSPAGGGEPLTLTATWKASNDGPVPQLTWGPPEYGDVLASCAPNGAVSIWEEVSIEGENNQAWTLAACIDDVHSPILDMKFAPSNVGLKLVVVFADGHARIYETSDTLKLKRWQLQAEFQNSKSLIEKNTTNSFNGASISWKDTSIANPHPAFVFGCNSTSGSLNIPKVWEFDQTHQRWFCIAELNETDEDEQPVSHVSWAPNIGRSYEMIAVASGAAISIWQLNFSSTSYERVNVKRVAQLKGSNEQVLQVEWDMSGMTLASSGSSGMVRLWQVNLKGQWQQCMQI